MDVLDARVMHAARATIVGIEDRLEHCAEDRRAHVDPIELGGGDYEVIDGGIDFWNVFGGVVEEIAIDVGECGEFISEIARTRLRSIEHAEEIDESGAAIFGVFEVAGELFRRKDIGVVGIETKHQPHAEARQ